MCGIAGAFNWNSKSPDPILLNKMNQAMLHRGPDGEGVWIKGPVGLVQRRLAIIDLSSNGLQPFHSFDGRFVLVFNGEIYNYLELKSKLSYPWKTSTDTEVLMAAWIEWGISCLSHLKGMFAFAVYDNFTSELYIVRDRLGIKPLYYSVVGDVVYFASEVRTLLATGVISPLINKKGIVNYLRFQTVNTPRTIVDGINALSPGNYIHIKPGKFFKIERYWNPLDKALYWLEQDLSESKAKSLIFEALYAAVERRLTADVPFGAFLSGGIDSTAIVALMSHIIPGRVNTFTISFEDKEFSEARFAAFVANKFKTNHNDIKLRPDDFLHDLPLALAALDHPSGDGPNTWVVSKATKNAGITMALSGLGGDEIFAGYPHFKQLFKLQKQGWLNILPLSTRRTIGGFLQKIKPSIATAKMAQALDSEYIDIESAYPTIRQVILEKQIADLVGTKNLPINRALEIMTQLRSDPRWEALPKLSKISLAEMNTYLLNVLLRDADQMSMAHALEVRVPFLDHELVELVLGIKDKIKFPNKPKQLLVDALGSLIPVEVWNRPKMGFTLPFTSWMQGPLNEFCTERLKILYEGDLFSKDVVLDQWNAFKKNDPRTSWSRLWTLVVLGDWIKRNNIQVSINSNLMRNIQPATSQKSIEVVADTQVKPKIPVHLFFRRKRIVGNFSIEQSFNQTIDSWNTDSIFTPVKIVSSYLSNGLFPRLLAIWEARIKQGKINHITGDIHFIALALPGNRTILTIHDCGFMLQLKGFKRWMMQKFWLKLPVEHVAFITCVSEATKRDIIRYTNCNPDKIFVIPTVIGDHFTRVDKSFNSDCPRILHIGLAPNKNFERHAMALKDINCHFHIIGKLNTSQIALLNDLSLSFSYEYNISEYAIQQAYADADLLLFASTLEGFGMPILEAQTVGTPVITSNLSSMPEVAGGAACLVNPLDIDSIRNGILKIINDKSYREDLILKGFRNVERFQPRYVATEYEKIYTKILV